MRSGYNFDILDNSSNDNNNDDLTDLFNSSELSNNQTEETNPPNNQTQQPNSTDDISELLDNFSTYNLDKNQAENLLIHLLKDDLEEIFKTAPLANKNCQHKFPLQLGEKLDTLRYVFGCDLSNHKLHDLMGIKNINSYKTHYGISFNEKIYKPFYDKCKPTILSAPTSEIKTAQPM